MQDPYCYPGSQVLKNKLAITDQEELKNEERNLTNLRSDDLLQTPLGGAFDLEHLQAIHQYLFQDVYDWAGEIRTVNIAKGSLFCLAPQIESQAKMLFDQLKLEKYLQNLGAGEISRRLAYYLSEINALHPFREGNGRAQREFIRELAYHNDYILTFADITKDEMIEASKAAFTADYRPMELLIGRVLRPI